MMQIGTSQVQAPELVLGTFGMGGGTSWQDTTKDDGELVDFIRQAYDLGIRGIDTAPVYGTGRSEKIVGEALKGHREDWYVSTKCCMQWRTKEGMFRYSRDGKEVYSCFKKPSLIQDVEESLVRMKMDYFDMMIIHRCPTLPEIPEVMDAMEELKRRQLIRSVGLSNAGEVDFGLDAVRECLKYGELDLVQEHASLLFRKNLGDYLRLCEDNHITFQDYYGLEKGALAGKFFGASQAGDNRSKVKWFQKEGIEKVNALTRGLLPIAEKYHCSVPVLVLAWLKAQSSDINLLVGARKINSLKDTLQVLEVRLSQDDMNEMVRLADIANA